MPYTIYCTLCAQSVAYSSQEGFAGFLRLLKYFNMAWRSGNVVGASAFEGFPGALESQAPIAPEIPMEAMEEKLSDDGGGAIETRVRTSFPELWIWYLAEVLKMLDASEVEVRRKGCFCIGSNSSRNLTSYKLSVYVMEEAFARSLTIFDSVATSVPLRTTTASTRQSAAGMPTLKTRTVFPETWIWNDLLPVK
uniref:Uncharacterized protein n=1 Tax=Ascaris lumbricoides TaxID=6252 RepID=A0A0M3HPK9_ASCLU